MHSKPKRRVPSRVEVRDFWVGEITNREAITFVKKHHYSKCCPNGFYNFGLFYMDDLVGVAVFGQVIGRNQAQYWYPASPERLIELRRLACIDETPKNTESYFIGYCLKWLKANTDNLAVISCADPNYGHEGTIYKASNFGLVGETLDDRARIMIDGRERHPKSLYNKHGTSSVPVLKSIYKHRIRFKDKRRKLVYLYEFLKRAESKDNVVPAVQAGKGGVSPTSALQKLNPRKRSVRPAKRPARPLQEVSA